MRGRKKPGAPKVAVIAALVSSKSSSTTSWPLNGAVVIALEVWRENFASCSTRRSGGLPQMITPLIAPIEMPATQSIR